MGWQTWEDVDKDWGGTKPADPYDPNRGSSSDALIPAGTKVWGFSTDQKKRQSPSGKVHVDVPFEIVYPPQYEGKWVWHQFWCTPPNLPYLKRDFQTLGWQIPSLSAIMQPQDKSLVNRGAEFVVGIESYEQNVTDENTGEQTTVQRKKNNVKTFTGPYAEGQRPWENQAAAPAAAPPAGAPPGAAPGGRATPPGPSPAGTPPSRPASAPAAPPAAPPQQEQKKGWKI